MNLQKGTKINAQEMHMATLICDESLDMSFTGTACDRSELSSDNSTRTRAWLTLTERTVPL